MLQKKPIKTWLGLPHGVIRRLIAAGVVAFPFVGSSITKREKPIQKPAVEKSAAQKPAKDCGSTPCKQ